MTTPPRMSASDIASAIQDAEQREMLLAELLAAAQQGVIGVACLVPGMAAPLGLMNKSGKASVVFIADDRGGGHDPGPAGWSDLDQLARWARQLVINPLREEIGSYIPAVAVALEHQRLVLIETAVSRVAAWQRAFSATKAPVVVLVSLEVALSLPTKIGKVRRSVH